MFPDQNNNFSTHQVNANDLHGELGNSNISIDTDTRLPRKISSKEDFYSLLERLHIHNPISSVGFYKSNSHPDDIIVIDKNSPGMLLKHDFMVFRPVPSSGHERSYFVEQSPRYSSELKEIEKRVIESGIIVSKDDVYMAMFKDAREKLQAIFKNDLGREPISENPFALPREPVSKLKAIGKRSLILSRVSLPILAPTIAVLFNSPPLAVGISTAVGLVLGGKHLLGALLLSKAAIRESYRQGALITRTLDSRLGDTATLVPKNTILNYLTILEKENNQNAREGSVTVSKVQFYIMCVTSMAIGEIRNASSNNVEATRSTLELCIEGLFPVTEWLKKASNKEDQKMIEKSKRWEKEVSETLEPFWLSQWNSPLLDRKMYEQQAD